MNNAVQPGRILTLTAPYAVLSGGGMLVGSIFGVASTDAAISTAVEAEVVGVFTLPKTSALAISVGDLLYWDDTNKVVNKTSSAQKLIGVAVSAAANPSATVDVRLNGAFTT
jgi:predicted RecA/RadA family phage recombinase